MSAISYRPDIDGLRAVAVLSVILFHAGVPFMGGGFVGVDVFFVISGFLITSLILKDLEAGSFTFARFWERRARRILPALGVVIVASLAAGWFLLLPEDYAALGKQATWQAFFSSNILFYKEAGYFDKAGDLKPLLHTWSLSVEEQFYIFFPLITVLIWKKFRRFFFLFLAGSAIISFILCLIVMTHNKSLGFYMLPFRGWELLLGAMLAWRAPAINNIAHRNFLSVAGLIGILAPVFLYTKDTVFPGWAALPPCLGAAALIWAGATGPSFVNKVLAWKPIVFIGLVSYSWYLWHWPAIVFSKYQSFVTYSPTVAAAAVGISLMLAVLSWRYVETPFRRFEYFALRKNLFIGAACMLALFIATGLTISKSDGVKMRLSEQALRYAEGVKDDNPHRKQCDKTRIAKINDDKVCQTNEAAGKPSFLLWGDSQADALAPAFFALSEKYNRNGYVATHHGCPPIKDYVKKDWESDCHEFNLAVMDFIKRNHVKNVILVASFSSWILYSEKTPENMGWTEPLGGIHASMGASALQRTIDELNEAGAKVYLVLDVPAQAFDVPRVLAKQNLSGVVFKKDVITREIYMKTRNMYLEPFVEKARGVSFIDPLERMCPVDECIYEHDGYSLYYNPGHISVHGAMYVAPVLEPYFKNKWK